LLFDCNAVDIPLEEEIETAETIIKERKQRAD
jgi:hypothetical protein